MDRAAAPLPSALKRILTLCGALATAIVAAPSGALAPATVASPCDALAPAIVVSAWRGVANVVARCAALKASSFVDLASAGSWHDSFLGYASALCAITVDLGLCLDGAQRPKTKPTMASAMCFLAHQLTGYRLRACASAPKTKSTTALATCLTAHKITGYRLRVRPLPFRALAKPLVFTTAVCRPDK